MPAGMMKFAASCLFIGTASYVSTFVAQYHGAGQDGKIGAILWQWFYVALIGGIGSLSLIPLAGPLFRLIGHGRAVEQYETIYFQVLCFGTIPYLASSAMSGFYSGRGKTWPIMWINCTITAVNIVLEPSALIASCEGSGS